jgi:hypothetical protein
MQPAEIAAERGMAIITIEGHLAHLVADGRAKLDDLVAPETATLIRAAIHEVGDCSRLTPLKDALPPHVSFGQIKCVLAADGLLPPPKPKAEGGNREQGIGDRKKASIRAGYPIPPETDNEPDAVSEYLSKSHPKPLSGAWRCGWSLGFHSTFAGSDWNRSGVGQLAYQLKYQADENALAPLVGEAMALIKKHPELAEVDAVVPVPPTAKRRFDPVSEFAGALARELGVAVLSAVEKVRSTDPQKEMHTLAQKRANVRGAFAVRQQVRGKRLLLIDDLFDSGATLEEVHRVLKSAGATNVPVLTLTRTIHSDS